MANSSKSNPTVIVILIAVAIAAVAGFVMLSHSQPEQTAAEENISPDAAVATGGIELGAAPYSLTATTGETITEKSFPDKYKLVYFGFTRCPDVCPTGLTNITTALTALGADADKIQPVFITVDPAYDTAQIIQDYLYNFDSRFIGATGTPEQIKAAQDSFRVYASSAQVPDALEAADQETKAAIEQTEHAHGAEQTHTMINHSDYIYFMSKDGKLLNVLPGNTDGQSISANIQTALAAELVPATTELPPAPAEAAAPPPAATE